jgi:hypothetical protein
VFERALYYFGERGVTIPKPHQRSLRDVAAELAKLGFLIERGKQFSASSVASMVQ